MDSGLLCGHHAGGGGISITAASPSAPAPVVSNGVSLAVGGWYIGALSIVEECRRGGATVSNMRLTGESESFLGIVVYYPYYCGGQYIPHIFTSLNGITINTQISS